MLAFEDRDRDSVLTDLRSEDPEVRRLAIERIDALDACDRLPRLVDALGDADWRVRKAVVLRIAEQPDAQATGRALLAALADGENPGRRNAAVEALVGLGAAVVGCLVEACDDPDADVRKFAVDALAGIGDERAVPRLIRGLAEPDANVRAVSADALGALGDLEAVEPLTRTATDAREDPLVRFSALHALDTLEVPMRSETLAGLLDDPLLGPAALALLGRCESDPGAADALLKGLASGVRAARESSIRGVLRWLARSDGAEAERFAARVREASRSHPKLVESAVSRLTEAELGSQLALIQFLGVVGDARGTIPILLACRDEALAQVALATLGGMDCAGALEAAWPGLEALERRHACEVLGVRGGSLAVARLVAALEDADVEVRAAAAHALGGLGDESALAPLVRRLEHADTEVDLEGEDEREAVVDALARLVAPSAEGRAHPWTGRAVDLLSAAWSGAEDAVRVSVAQVLARIARRQDAELISLLLGDPSAEVRSAAVDAIARLEPASDAEPLHLAIADESPEVRAAAARALGAVGGEAAFEDLRSLCEDENARVRATAVRALGRRFAGADQPALRAAALAVLARACEDTVPVALAVVEAVAEIGGEASSYLAPLLQRSEPEVVREAVRHFGRAAEPAELDRLLHLVSHPSWLVRAEVIEVLAERRVRRAVPAILRRLETEQDEFVRRAMLAALQTLED